MKIKNKKKSLISLFALTLFVIFMFGNVVTVEAKTYDTQESIINEIRRNLLARNEEFTINTSDEIAYIINSNSEEFINKAIAIDKTSTSKDGDYLAYSFKGYNISFNISDRNAVLEFNIQYYLNPTQEKEIDKKIKSILTKLDLKEAKDYKKVKAIHDYIIKLAKYDQTYTRYTAYDIFTNKSAVCQGYAQAAYRLFTDAGIKCRIITGYAGGSRHAWNIVKVNGKWYNIDLTWDDPVSYDGKQILSYDYFLKNDRDFVNHRRDSEFRTTDFIGKYTISENSYKLKK